MDIDVGEGFYNMILLTILGVTSFLDGDLKKSDIPEFCVDSAAMGSYERRHPFQIEILPSPDADAPFATISHCQVCGLGGR